MTGYLLDTTVLSEPMKRRPSATLIERLRVCPVDRLFTSSICVMELRKGAQRHPRSEGLWHSIATRLLPLVRVLPVSARVAVTAGDLLAYLEASGTPIGLQDVLIGATAKSRELVVVTRNLRHFDRLPGCQAESWFG